MKVKGVFLLLVVSTLILSAIAESFSIITVRLLIDFIVGLTVILTGIYFISFIGEKSLLFDKSLFQHKSHLGSIQKLIYRLFGILLVLAGFYVEAITLIRLMNGCSIISTCPPLYQFNSFIFDHILGK